MRSMSLATSAAIFILGFVGAARARDPHPDGLVGTTFPVDFPRIIDASLGVPIIGFGGSQGRVERLPVIFLHGNNDTPFPTTCRGLGYQGDQCDLVTNPTNRSGHDHSTVANVPDLRAFVRAVLAYTGAKRVDIVAHSLGVTLTREWMRQDHAFHLVRALVAIDGPNHGIISCSPSPLNYFQLPSLGGFTPDSAICREYGSDHTPLLQALNRGRETRGPTRYLVLLNTDVDFVYISAQDGVFAAVPAEDRDGKPHDFSRSARLEGATTIELTRQGQFDAILGTAHLGIVNSPWAWSAALGFLRSLDEDDDESD